MKPKSIFFAVVAIVLLTPSTAYAYLDPGAGSAILQAILAGIVTIGVVLKIYWYWILKFLGFKKDENSVKKDTSKPQ